MPKPQVFYPIEYKSRKGWDSTGIVFQDRHAAGRWVVAIKPAERRWKYRVGLPLVAR